MRLKAMVLIVAALMAVALAGCSGNDTEVFGREVVTGSGKAATETRVVTGFNAVSLEGAGTVVIEQGTEEGLVIEADDNLLEYLKAEVVDGVFVLGFQDDAVALSLNPVSGITFRVKARTVDGIGLSGAGKVTTGPITGESLRVEGAGAGVITIESFDGRRFTVDVDGGANVTVAGTVESQEVTIKGTGDYAAENLHSKTAAINIDGAGNARVWADDTLEVQISGAGAVQYKGSPQVSKDITGLGVVTAIGS